MLSRSLLFILIALCSFSALANDAHTHAKNGQWKVVFEMLRAKKANLNTIKDGETLFDIAMLSQDAVDVMLAFARLGAQTADDLNANAVPETQPLDDAQLQEVDEIIGELWPDKEKEDGMMSPLSPLRPQTPYDAGEPCTDFALPRRGERTTVEGEESIALAGEIEEDELFRGLLDFDSALPGNLK